MKTQTEGLEALRHLMLNDLPAALEQAGKVLSKAESHADPQFKAEAFHIAGKVYDEARQLDEALKLYHRAVEEGQKAGDRKLTANSYNNIGLIYHDRAQFQEAIPYYLKAVEIKKELNELKSLTGTYTNLGIAYEKLSEYKKAMEVYYLSLKISEEIGDEHRKATAYQNIGIIHYNQHDYEGAFDIYKKALALRAGDENKVPVIQLKNNMGLALKWMKRYEEAILYFEEALTEAQACKFSAGITIVNNNKGELYMELGDFTNAFSAFMKCYLIAKESNDDSVLLTSIINLGEVHLSLKEYEKADNFLQKALVLSKKTGYKAKEQEVYKLLTRLYEEQDDAKKSLEYYKQYDQLKSSISNTESSNAINEIKIKYEVAKKEKELQKVKLLQVESELKALRAQMDPHFVFNSLNSIRKELLEGDMENADRYIVRFSRLLRLILDTTRTPVVKLSDNLELLHLYIQIEQSRHGNKFDYSIDVDKRIKPEELYVPGLILQPLVENAIIHGLFHKQNSKGQLTIGFKLHNDCIEIKVSDNGVGREKSGVKPRNGHKSHAMDIIRETLQLTWKSEDICKYFIISDKKDTNGEPAGTEVTVLLPFNLDLSAAGQPA